MFRHAITAIIRHCSQEEVLNKCFFTICIYNYIIYIYNFTPFMEFKCGEQLEVSTAKPLSAFQNLNTEIIFLFQFILANCRTPNLSAHLLDCSPRLELRTVAGFKCKNVICAVVCFG
jgi:hypothetical protein